MGEVLRIFTDAAARGNPGPAAVAYSIYGTNGNLLKEHAEYIGERITNNTAEYTAMILALKAAFFFSKGEISCFSDSEFLINQVIGKSKVKVEHIKKLYLELKEEEKKFAKVNYFHLPREDPKISRMDKMVNKILDAAEKLGRKK